MATEEPSGPEPIRADDQLRYHPKMGELVVDGVLREFSDPGPAAEPARSARVAIERFVAERADDLKAGAVELREDSADEGAATLRIRYAQYINDLPVFGAGLHAAARLERPAVTRVANKVEVEVADAPDRKSVV